MHLIIYLTLIIERIHNVKCQTVNPIYTTLLSHTGELASATGDHLLSVTQSWPQLQVYRWPSLNVQLRVSVSKNQRNHGHGQKIDFAHTLSV